MLAVHLQPRQYYRECKRNLRERFLAGRGFALYPSPGFAPLAVDKAGLRSLANRWQRPLRKTILGCERLPSVAQSMWLT